MNRARTILRYSAFGLGWTLVITAAGAALGALTFPLIGALAGADASAASLALSGAKNLGFLAFIWAPGAAIVLAFRRAYLRRQSSS